jgi:four helix bundle protein
MRTFRYLDFPLYKKAKALYREISRVSEPSKDFALKSQIRRASLSVILNIAEGSTKSSDKGFARFLEISVGSVNEVYACLDILQECGSIAKEDFDRLGRTCEETAKQLGGFIKKLKNPS